MNGDEEDLELWFCGFGGFVQQQQIVGPNPTLLAR